MSHKDWTGNPMNVHQQQDVDEFFHMLCQRLETIIKGTSQEKLLQTVFGGTFSNEIRSLEKNYPYYAEREEEFFTISLDIKNKRSIQHALDLYVQGDKLEGTRLTYFCSDRPHLRYCWQATTNIIVINITKRSMWKSGYVSKGSLIL